MSHHGNNPFQPEGEEPNKYAAADALKQFQKVLQGEFPDGRLNANDQGALACSVGHEKGKVVMMFAQPTAWIGFTPNQAMDIAQMLIKHAREAGIVGVYELKLK